MMNRISSFFTIHWRLWLSAIIDLCLFIGLIRYLKPWYEPMFKFIVIDILGDYIWYYPMTDRAI